MAKQPRRKGDRGRVRFEVARWYVDDEPFAGASPNLLKLLCGRRVTYDMPQPVSGEEERPI